MTIKIDNLMKTYSDWLLQNTTAREINGAIEITLPYLDRNNDWIQVYLIEQDDGKLLLTDDGYTIANLQMAGYSLNSKEHQAFLQETVNGHAVTLTPENELQIITTERDFPQKLNNLIQVMLQLLSGNMRISAD